MSTEDYDYSVKLRELLTRHHMSGHPDPGGAEWYHPIAGRIHVPDMDYKEDYERIVAFLIENGIAP